MARIVVVLMDPPLPFGNASARWYYVLCRGLAERGHALTVFTPCPTDAQAEEVRRLFPAGRHDVRLYPHPRRLGRWRKLESMRRPYSYMFSKSLAGDVRSALARGADLMHLESPWGGWMARGYERRTVVAVQYLADLDRGANPPRGLIDRSRQVAVRAAERRLLRRFPHLVTLTPRLTDRVRQICPGAEVFTVPLALDLSLYPFEPDGSTDDRPPTVGLIGSFGWGPSRTAGVRLLTRLWPAIRRRVPGVRLLVAGWEARKALADLAEGPEVDLVEDVPEILPYFRRLDVMLFAPRHGSGMKVKVMESFALGIPVVTTTEGVEGLPAEDGVHAGICDDDEGLIDRAVALLEDPALRVRRRRAGRALVESCCAPDVVLDRLERVYESILHPDAESSR